MEVVVAGVDTGVAAVVDKVLVVGVDTGIAAVVEKVLVVGVDTGVVAVGTVVMVVVALALGDVDRDRGGSTVVGAAMVLAVRIRPTSMMILAIG